MTAEDYREDQAIQAPLLALAALLDHQTLPWHPGLVPPLGHWLYFHPQARQSDLREDGHPRGDLLLPADLPPRRMWVGSRIEFIEPIAVGARLQRRTHVSAVTRKSGRSGPLVFVTLHHVLSVLGRTALIEEQDIVYRAPATATGSRAIPGESFSGLADGVRDVTLGPVALFRYSALTFNAHRIHYDRDYATEIEGYDGLVVQGPFLATLLMDHFHRQYPGHTIGEFRFRASKPVYADRPLRLCLRHGDGGALLWVEADGTLAFEADVRAGEETR